MEKSELGISNEKKFLKNINLGQLHSSAGKGVGLLNVVTWGGFGTVEGQNQLLQVVLWSTYPPYEKVISHTYTKINK